MLHARSLRVWGHRSRATLRFLAYGIPTILLSRMEQVLLRWLIAPMALHKYGSFIIWLLRLRCGRCFGRRMDASSWPPFNLPQRWPGGAAAMHICYPDDLHHPIVGLSRSSAASNSPPRQHVTLHSVGGIPSFVDNEAFEMQASSNPHKDVMCPSGQVLTGFASTGIYDRTPVAPQQGDSFGPQTVGVVGSRLNATSPRCGVPAGFSVSTASASLAAPLGGGDFAGGVQTTNGCASALWHAHQDKSRWASNMILARGITKVMATATTVVSPCFRCASSVRPTQRPIPENSSAFAATRSARTIRK